jgi:hypothetical protein
MDEEKRILICIRVSEATEPPAVSYVDTCDKCSKSVWHALSSPEVDVVWCGNCAVVEIEINASKGGKSEFQPLTKEQLEEVRWWRMNFGPYG